MRRWLMTTVVLVAGCASGHVPPPTVEPGQPETEVVRENVFDDEPLHDARDALRDDDFGIAATIADSLLEAWSGAEELDSGSAGDLVDLLTSVGADDGAAHLLFHAPFDLDGGERGTLRRLSERLSIAELQSLLAEADGGVSQRSIVSAELARALAIAGHPERAEDLAERVLAGSPDGPDGDKAEDVLAGRTEPRNEAVKVGVVLPGSGRFEVVGNQILEGVLLAAQRYEADPEHSPFELIVLDDSSRVDLGIELIHDLENRDVVAVLGPLRTEALVSAAIRREHTDLLLISPTASGGQGVEMNAYTLWDRARREADVAAAVGTWMAADMGLATFGVLHPAGQSEAALEALSAAVAEAGGTIVGVQPYVADSMTFGSPITALAAAEPDAVVVLADRPRTVLQIAPQLVYYGLRRWVTGGDANWSDPSVVRRLDPSYADHRLVGTFVDRVTPEASWKEYEAAYEAQYRKALPSNMFGSLGFDAMNLILAGIPEAEPERRGAIGRSLRRGSHVGATGEMSVDLRTGELHRAVFVRVIQGGELLEPDPAEMLLWAEQQRELEEFLKALEEEKEEGDEGAGGNEAAERNDREERR